MLNLKGAKTISASEGKKYSSAIDVLKDFSGSLKVSVMALTKGTETLFCPAMYRTVGTDTVTNEKVTFQGVTFEAACKVSGSEITPKVYLDRFVETENKSVPIWNDKLGLWVAKGLWTALENSEGLEEFSVEEYAALNRLNDDGTGKEAVTLDGYTVKYYYGTVNATRKGRVTSFGGKTVEAKAATLTAKGRNPIEGMTNDAVDALPEAAYEALSKYK